MRGAHHRVQRRLLGKVHPVKRPFHRHIASHRHAEAAEQVSKTSQHYQARCRYQNRPPYRSMKMDTGVIARKSGMKICRNTSRLTTGIDATPHTPLMRDSAQEEVGKSQRDTGKNGVGESRELGESTKPGRHDGLRSRVMCARARGTYGCLCLDQKSEWPAGVDLRRLRKTLLPANDKPEVRVNETGSRPYLEFWCRAKRTLFPVAGRKRRDKKER